MREPGKKAAPGRACGLDLGKARVGVAVSDELGLMAHPRGVISGKNQPELIRALCKLVEDELWDERLSTVEARRNLAASEVHGAKAKAHIDEASAVVLLQAYLERRN